MSLLNNISVGPNVIVATADADFDDISEIDDINTAEILSVNSSGVFEVYVPGNGGFNSLTGFQINRAYQYTAKETIGLGERLFVGARPLQQRTIGNFITKLPGVVNGSGGAKNLSQTIKIDSKSALRNYKLEAFFTIGFIGANAYGVAIGVDSLRNTNIGPQVASTYAVIDYSSTPTLQIVGTDGTGAIQTISATSTAAIPVINTSDRYKISLEIFENTAIVIFYNLTAGTQKQIQYTYDLTTLYGGGGMLRPNLFNYAYGVLGNSQVDFSLFTVNSTEKKYVDILFVGDSITTGYYAGSALNCFAYKLRSHTNKTVQVMAGGGNRVQDTINNFAEIVAINPAIIFLMIGTNDGSSSAAFTQLQTLYNDLVQASITVNVLTTPDGDNPATNGTYNHSVTSSFGGNSIDIWTAGWNTMTTGNGEMVDTVHPTDTGTTKIANLIKAARNNLFNL